MPRGRQIGMVLLGAAVLALGSGRLGRAQTPDDANRGVARISLMDGQVSVKRGDAGEWVAGVINAPLMTGDHISTAPNSRAEVELDSTNVLRIGGNAEVNLATLESGRYQVEVAHGTVTYAILRASSANVEVDTPSVSVKPNGQGAYRIAVNDGGVSQITVRAGQAEVFTPHGSQEVSAGQTMQARGSATDPEYQMVNAIPMDEWDHWNQQRDQALTQARSPQYLPQGVYGGEDLDHYGNWNNVPPYGEVWTPTVGGWLGAVSRRPVGVAGLVWLDVGEQRPVGVGALPLWPLVLGYGLRLVLVSGRDRRAPLLVPGAGRILWFRPRHRGGIRIREYRLGAAWAL